MIENSLFLSFGENFVIVNIVSLHFPSFLFVSVSFGDGHYQKIEYGCLLLAKPLPSPVENGRSQIAIKKATLAASLPCN